MKDKIPPNLYELWMFFLKLARASVFAGSFFFLLFASTQIPLFGLARYDFLFLAAILIQILLVVFKLETKHEVKMIFLFHIIGMILELFKTSAGIASWSYPEPAFFKIWTVPLYSGFMYSAVASFMMQAWQQLDLKLKNYPRYRYSLPLAGLIYLNFFTHHYIPDLRWFLAALVVILFWQTEVHFKITDKVRRMKLLWSFFLIGLFIWIAENISTYYGAWQYPDQIDGWTLVGLGKISSWTLLVIISFIIVADLKHLKKQKAS